MLLINKNKIDFSDEKTKKAFSLKGVDIEQTWEFYYESYTYALQLLTKQDLLNQYFYNPRCRPFLFLLRHNWELCLKLNLHQSHHEIPRSHDFKVLFKTFKDNELDFDKNLEKLFNKLNYEGDGACFKYLSNKQGKPYFPYGSKIELASIFRTYNLLFETKSIEKFQIGNICEPFPYNNRIIKNNLTLGVGEAYELGHIRTQYNHIIEFFLKGIIEGKFDIRKLILPLLFLIRHSLEIGWKSNIAETQKKSKLIKGKDYSNEHSLATLYNCYSNFLNKIEENNLHEDTLKIITAYQIKYNKLNDIIHNLDFNSNFFRFPFDESGKKINLKNKTLSNVLNLLYETDDFVTFIDDALFDDCF
jgi:hypothetical protein